MIAGGLSRGPGRIDGILLLILQPAGIYGWRNTVNYCREGVRPKWEERRATPTYNNAYNWKKNTVCIIFWTLFQQSPKTITKKISLYVVIDCLHSLRSSQSPLPPLRIPQVRGEGSEVKGEVAGCLSCRSGAGVGGPLAQPLSLVWEERSLLLLLLTPSCTSGCPQNTHLEGKQECFYFPGEKKNSRVKPQS